MLDLAVPLAKDVLSKLATKATSSISDRFERKLIGQGSVRAGRGLTLFISNEDMGGFFKIVESLEKSSFFQKKIIDGATETIKHKIKNKKVDFVLLINIGVTKYINCEPNGTFSKVNWPRIKDGV